ncbi:MAG: hypothetical protein ACYDEV_03475 [Acidiferrobacter sp.]
MENRNNWTVFAMFAVLFFIWPIPHTIALRNVLLFVLTLWISLHLDPARGHILLRAWRLPLWGLGLFTAWLFIGLAFTPFWREALHAIGGQWLSALVAGFIGAALGALRGGLSFRNILMLFVAVLVLHALVVDGQGLAWVIHYGRLPVGLDGCRDPGLTAGPDKSNYLTNMTLDLLVAELSLRLEGERFFPIGKLVFAAALVAAALSSYLEGMRNGLIDIIVLTAFLVARFIYRNRAHFGVRRRMAVGGIVLIALVLVGLDLRFDHRWDTLYATVPIAWNTVAHRQAWLNPGAPLPLLPNGEPVSQSNYLRIAWIKEGFKSLFDFPWGLGYSRSAFGKALLLRFGKGAAIATSTNDGLLNLGIGVGFPGLILWYFWYGATVRGALSFLSGRGAFWGRALLLVLLDVGTRMLVDANLQDYMLEQFLFLVALLASGAAASVIADSQHVPLETAASLHDGPR